MTKIFANLCGLAVIAALVLPGCNMKSIANSYLLASLQGSQNSLQQSENYQLLERALPPFIVLIDSALQDDPENVPMLRKAAELNTSYALSFIEDKDPRWASLHYQKAREYMWRVMRLKYQIRRQDIIGLQEKQVEKKLAAMGRETVPDLFWWGMSWGLLINVKRDDVATISEFPYVRVIMERVLQLAPDYQNGLPHLFFGVYYGSSTKALGGKPEQGKKHFEQIYKITHGEFLLAKVLCAKTYARSVQNRQLYERLLNEVVQAPLAKNADFRLGNAMAKKQAEDLLNKIDEYFVPEKPALDDDSKDEEESWW